MNVNHQQAVLFTVGGQLFAIEADHVSEFLWLPALSFLEEQPGYVRGAFELRGELVLTVDLNLRFGHPTGPLRAQQGVIVTRTPGGVHAIIIDELIDLESVVIITPLNQSQLSSQAHQPALDKDAAVHARFIKAEFSHRDRLGAMLDLAELIPNEPPAFDALIERVDPMLGVPDDTAKRLLERRDQYQQATETDSEDVSRAVVVVLIGGEQFAFPLANVKEFAYQGRVFSLVGAPGHVRGNINLRGEIVTVFDISGFLGLPPVHSTQASPLVVFKHGQELAAFVVDELVDIVGLEMEKIGALPIGIPKSSRSFLQGEYRFGDRPLIIVDVTKLFASDLLLVEH